MQKEKELIEKKLQRLEAARSTDISVLQAELEASKSSLREQTKDKDTKINELVEELGNTQALLSDRVNELAQVTLCPAGVPHQHLESVSVRQRGTSKFLVSGYGSDETTAASCLQFKDEAVELEDLREMKADIERREKAQATVIENQAKRLEELETLYKVQSPPIFL